MKRTIWIAAAALALAACGGNAPKKAATTADARQTASAVPDGHTAETSLDYRGTYTGTFPAADCPGIEMRLRLKDDGTYDLHMKYIDRDAAFDERGRYEVKENLLTLTPDTQGDSASYYKVEENRLRRLDMERQPITGPLAEHYVLTKKQ